MRFAKSLRFRTAGLAAGVVTLALVIAAVALVTLTRRNLIDSAESDALTSAQVVAELASAGAVPDPLPPLGVAFGQLIGPTGDVVAATRNVAVEFPISELQAAPGASLKEVSGEVEGEEGEELGGIDGRFAIAVVGVAIEGGTAQAVAAVSLADADEAVGVLVPLLALGVPLLAALVFATAWRMVGRSLAPIEAMRREAEVISIADLDRRVPTSDSADEVGRLAETLNSMLARLHDSVTKQRRFVADASHELKSPIASLVTMSEVAGANPESVDTGALASDVATEAKRLALLTDDLLALAKSDEKGLELRLTAIDLAEIVRQEAARVTVEVDTSDVTSVVANVDRLRMGQVVRNLIDNAARHADGVWVATSTLGSSARIIVADDGPGIQAADRERVFDRFERLDEARSRDAGGSGLGLAVVKAIVEAHGGSVAVVDNPKYPGAVFSVEVPS